MPPGRPPKITKALVKRIGESLAVIGYRDTASALQGITRDTLNEWLKRGAREKERVTTALAKDPTATVQESERLFVELTDVVEKAISVANDRDLRVIDRRAQGGIPERIVTTRTKQRPAVTDDGKAIMVESGQVQDGKPVMVALMITETVTEVRETATLPEWTAAAWKLERRDPRNFGRRTYKEVTGADGKELIPMSVIRAVMAAQDAIPDADFEVMGTEQAPGSGSAPRALMPGTGVVDLNDAPPRLPEE